VQVVNLLWWDMRFRLSRSLAWDRSKFPGPPKSLGGLRSSETPNYALRTSIEERHRQYKCFWDLVRMPSRKFSNALLQAHLFFRHRRQMNARTRGRILDIRNATVQNALSNSCTGSRGLSAAILFAEPRRKNLKAHLASSARSCCNWRWSLRSSMLISVRGLEILRLHCA
jgi:hypothetical protein